METNMESHVTVMHFTAIGPQKHIERSPGPKGSQLQDQRPCEKLAAVTGPIPITGRVEAVEQSDSRQ